ncbi:MAG TPA: superoxide dismutase family protein [Steroidobacteraceae bacterium]|nr:superoxide dismutase family protein [Steroidobacteraceae bacterium]
MNVKYWLSLCAASALLAGCGQRDQPAATTEAPGTPSAPAPADASPTASGASGPSVKLAPTQGQNASGTLALVAEGDGVRVTGTLQGLSPNAEFGFHIHEKGDCSAPDASSAGAHFNPANMPHGDPQGLAHHAGDMLNAKSDMQGAATVDAVATGVSLGSGQPNDVRGRAIVLHEKADDYATQPSGDSGARIACGVID